MNQQRTAIYKKRKEIMIGKNLERMFLNQMEELISENLDQIATENMKKEEWNIEKLQIFMKRIFDIEFSLPPLEELSLDHINITVQQSVQKRFEEKKLELKEHFEPLIQFLFLQTMDTRWREHLENVDHLREGINLRAFAQKDPLVEYKKESFHLFESLNLTVAGEVMEKFFKIQISEEDQFENTNKSQLIYNESSANISAFSSPPSQQNRPREERSLNRKQRRQQSQSFRKQKIKI